MPRRNHKAKGKDFESMSGAKIKALLESLQWEWKQRIGQQTVPPADMTRW